jgi:hypothetical protein
LELKEFFMETMGDVMNDEEITTFTMQEAQKLGIITQTPARYKSIRSKPAPTPPPAKAAFTLNTTAALEVKAEPIEAPSSKAIADLKHVDDNLNEIRTTNL